MAKIAKNAPKTRSSSISYNLKTSFLFMIAGGTVITITGLYTVLFANFLNICNNLSSGTLSSLCTNAFYINFFVNSTLYAGIIGIISGIVVILAASEAARKTLKRKWAIASMVFAFISIIDTGGFVIGMILALIGAMIEIADS